MFSFVFAKSSVASCSYLNIFEHYSSGFWFLMYNSIISLAASLVGILNEDCLKLYTLIWKRTMACQMESSRTELVGYCFTSFLHVVYYTPFFCYQLKHSVSQLSPNHLMKRPKKYIRLSMLAIAVNSLPTSLFASDLQYFIYSIKFHA